MIIKFLKFCGGLNDPERQETEKHKNPQKQVFKVRKVFKGTLNLLLSYVNNKTHRTAGPITFWSSKYRVCINIYVMLCVVEVRCTFFCLSHWPYLDGMVIQKNTNLLVIVQHLTKPWCDFTCGMLEDQH